MLSKVIVSIVRRSMCNNARILCHPQYSLHSDLSLRNGDAKPHRMQNHNLYITKRFKSKKKAANIKKDMSEDFDEEKEEHEEEIPAGSKMMKIKVPSLRLDIVSKNGFKLSRNKVEEAFYESRFRVNGNKVLKKSKEMAIGDEIDIVLHQSADNPGLLVVNRIVILSMNPASEGVQIKLSVDKNLLIEDYEDPYI